MNDRKLKFGENRAWTLGKWVSFVAQTWIDRKCTSSLGLTKVSFFLGLRVFGGVSKLRFDGDAWIIESHWQENWNHCGSNIVSLMSVKWIFLSFQKDVNERKWGGKTLSFSKLVEEVGLNSNHTVILLIMKDVTHLCRWNAQGSVWRTLPSALAAGKHFDSSNHLSSIFWTFNCSLYTKCVRIPLCIST